MKAILSQDHYALLEVNRFAPKSEIVKSYHRIKSAFDPDSLATYSLFDPEEAKAIASRVDEAFRVLIDERKKEIYDRWLLARERGENQPEPVFTRDAANDAAVATAVATSGTTDVKPFTPRKVPVLRPVPAGGFPPASAPTAAATASVQTAPMPIPQPPPTPVVAGPPIGTRPPPANVPPVDEVAIRNILATAAERDGSFFRAIREARGLEIVKIAEITKINVMYLRFIEENNYRDLPAPVYLRGFLVQVARFHKLEAPDQIAEAYMTIMEKRKKESS